MAEIVLKVENLTKHFPVRGSRSRSPGARPWAW